MSSMAIGTPEPLLVPRSVDPDALSVQFYVDDRLVEAQRTENGWVVQTVIPEGQNVSLSVEWFESIGEQQLRVAAWSADTGPLDSSRIITIESEALETDAFDFDGDGISNLAERQAGTDPFVAEGGAAGDQAGNVEDEAAQDADSGAIEPLVSGPAPGEDPALDVRLPFADPAAAGSIEIDGVFDPQWSDLATFAGENAVVLWVNRLLTIVEKDKDDPTLQDGVPDYNWFGMHDGIYLYLFVQSENAEVGPQTPFRDSPPERWFNDDAISVLFDPNLSRERLMQSDDVYFAFQLVTADGEQGPPLNSVGTSLPAPPGLAYDACPCVGFRSGWEMKIPLAEIGLSVGQTFGLELQIHEDIDGQGRDALYGWAGPPLDRQGEDFAFESPALFGTVMLQEP